MQIKLWDSLETTTLSTDGTWTIRFFIVSGPRARAAVKLAIRYPDRYRITRILSGSKRTMIVKPD